jgi:ABC-type nitrate/sulfonate/bicarbonate transport system ATPase subunit
VARAWLTIIMVTHDIKEAFKLGTRVLALRQAPPSIRMRRTASVRRRSMTLTLTRKTQVHRKPDDELAVLRLTPLIIIEMIAA